MCGENVFAEEFANWEGKTIKEKVKIWDEYFAREKDGNQIVKYNPDRIQNYPERPENNNQLIKYNENTFLKKLKEIINLNQQTQSQTNEVQGLSKSLIDMLRTRNFKNLTANITKHSHECGTLIMLLNKLQTCFQNITNFFGSGNQNMLSDSYLQKLLPGPRMPQNTPYMQSQNNTTGSPFPATGPVNYFPVAGSPQFVQGMSQNSQHMYGHINQNMPGMNNATSAQIQTHYMNGTNSSALGTNNFLGQASTLQPELGLGVPQINNMQGVNAIPGKIGTLGAGTIPNTQGMQAQIPSINGTNFPGQGSMLYTIGSPFPVAGSTQNTQIASSIESKNKIVEWWKTSVTQYKKLTLSKCKSSLQGREVKYDTIIRQGKGCFNHDDLFRQNIINSDMLRVYGFNNPNELMNLWQQACSLYLNAKKGLDIIKTAGPEKYKEFVDNLYKAVESLFNTLKDLVNILDNNQNTGYINTTHQLTYVQPNRSVLK